MIDFDGGDKVAATKTIAMTRTSWAGVTGTLFAGCVEVFDTNNWGTDYRAPVGVNMADNVDYQMFEYTALSIMAGEDDSHGGHDRRRRRRRPSRRRNVTLDEGQPPT